MIFLADFPPPVHGMSNVNLAVYEALLDKTDHANVYKIDTSPPVNLKYVGTRYWVLFKLLFFPLLIARLVFSIVFKKHRVVYRATNGGFGQIFDCFFLLVCRLFKLKIFIHHHTFDCLRTKTRLFSLLNIIAGRFCIHVVLGEEMKTALSERYGIDSANIRIVSNLAFFDEAGVLDVENCERIRIGHLANLCEDKGLDVYLAVCRALKESGFVFDALLAGPFLDKEAEVLYEENKDVVTYLGPVYGDKKDAFFQSINVFVLPSVYKNEAEPLVLYEAARLGSLLIGTEIGCMASVIERLQGITLNGDVDLINQIVLEFQSDKFLGLLSKPSVELRRDLYNVKSVNDKKVLNIFVDELLS